MTVRFIDPRAEPGASVDPYELSIDPFADGAVIGLLANGFPDSEAFLDQLEKALATALPAATFRRFNKRDASSVVSDDMLDSITAECLAVVAAYGH